MKILLDGEQLEISAEQETEMLIEFQARGIEMYESQGLELQLLAMPFARWILAKMEKAARQKFGKERAIKLCRPPRLENGKKADPVVFLTGLMLDQFREMLRYAELNVVTDGERHATGFSLRFQAKGATGRQVVLDGNEREREDYGA